MTSTDVGFLWFVDDTGASCEILNDHRTRHYQALHPLWAGDSCANCECAVLGYDPCSGVALEYGEAPDDGGFPAPWFDEGAPASADFLGWMTTSVDGFDYSHYNRTVNQRARSGANLTPMRAGGREITFTIIGTALSERGMVYGLNWLATNLLSLGGRCGSGRVLVRPWCDDTGLPGTIDDGLFELREVAVTVPPQWTDNFLAENGCLVREARFTILAGDPCFYGCRSTVCSTTGLALTRTPINTICAGATIRQLVCGPMPVWLANNAVSCCSIPSVAVIDSVAASVTITANARSGPFSIETYRALPGTDCNSVVGDASRFIGRVAIGRLDAGQSALIDGASGQVYFKAGVAAEWEPDDSLLVFEVGDFPCFPRQSGCDDMIVAVRPGSACVSLGTFSVSVEAVTITSCTTC